MKKTTGLQWVEARDAVSHRQPLITKDYLVQNVFRDEAEAGAELCGSNGKVETKIKKVSVY